ncbi:class I SAM-dependent methyltransferase [Amnibacterium sp.]|uniref:class I SAM-dependent methyltransferase n=1 Tax=Amnibacterium sp. TaxID=1872496 RepID=UPI002626BB2D|nr:class I SAM-dependent methyltransferase [Amnibacterium sp.]MCU1474510.1 Methyltransferase type 11 [Amnibacterium sp.]
MSFDVAAEDYQRFMGRYSEQLAVRFLDVLAPQPGSRALDVGAGPGVLTAPLAALLGPAAVAAVEPSRSFVRALRERLPEVDVREAPAEALPFPGDSFDLAAAQLVVNFMTDPVAGLAEMARVTKRGGVVAASVWDYGGDRSPLSPFWSAVREVDPGAAGESGLPGARDGELVRLLAEAGLTDVRGGELTVSLPYRDFDDWWQPYTLGVGPAGAYLARLHPAARERLRQHCADRMPPGPGVVTATAWLAVGSA